jgi:hypothetical protein
LTYDRGSLAAGGESVRGAAPSCDPRRTADGGSGANRDALPDAWRGAPPSNAPRRESSGVSGAGNRALAGSRLVYDRGSFAAGGESVRGAAPSYDPRRVDVGGSGAGSASRGALTDGRRASSPSSLRPGPGVVGKNGAAGGKPELASPLASAAEYPRVWVDVYAVLTDAPRGRVASGIGGGARVVRASADTRRAWLALSAGGAAAAAVLSEPRRGLSVFASGTWTRVSAGLLSGISFDAARRWDLSALWGGETRVEVLDWVEERWRWEGAAGITSGGSGAEGAIKSVRRAGDWRAEARDTRGEPTGSGIRRPREARSAGGGGRVSRKASSDEDESARSMRAPIPGGRGCAVEDGERPDEGRSTGAMRRIGAGTACHPCGARTL